MDMWKAKVSYSVYETQETGQLNMVLRKIDETVERYAQR
jgi:hypothetical protein